MSNTNRLCIAACLILAFGHTFDMLVGLDVHRRWDAFGAIAEIYGRWDPGYVAQPFYMKITSLTSGLIMLPLTLALAWGFAREAAWRGMVAVFYLGFICCGNVIWLYNEAMGPVGPESWGWTIGLYLPWQVLPIWLAWVGVRGQRGEKVGFEGV